MSINMSRLIFFCFGVMLSSAVWMAALENRNHFDYESCSEMAGTNAAFSEALDALLASCADQYPARRDSLGDGYIYVDEMSGLSFAIPTPVPSATNWIEIRSAVEAHAKEVEKSRLAEEEARLRELELREEQDRQRREVAAALAEEREWRRQECLKLNDKKRQYFAREQQTATKNIIVTKRTMVSNKLFQTDRPVVKVTNLSGFPVSSLKLRFQYMTQRGEYDSWQNIVCPTVPQYSWTAFSSQNSLFPVGGTMQVVVPDSQIVGRAGDWLLCTSVESAEFQRPKLNLENCY
ncbi:hypothetical protein E0F26_09555 [Candidatus Paraluminiphilus aquimaris]|uniref:Uncharacterized protein n=1 Tax=Candidatus Paraluminiphilus aquimaris TaxID=2518994 RepID=A0ABY6Q7T0_9GAMM|nr:hypothetical protein [Candidatus Paraluminiphilus aquimaris]UZP74965.1 hypothetical protein E0F26_09555 [Candidatus Paraluminiphilus aquimaris]